jgi:hypothetical protein
MTDYAAGEGAMAKAKEKRKGLQEQEEQGLPFTRKNYLVFGVGVLSVILGFITLSRGSTTLAPVLLILGYCVIIPISILLK